jgi:membrane protease subunit HflC
MTKLHKYLILTAVAFVILINSIFVVDQRKQALVLQFGEAMRVVYEPGLKFKLPFVQNVEFFDNRILDLSIKEQEVIASDQKRLIIDAFAKYKITDPLKFYTTVNNGLNAESKFSRILDSSLRRIIGEVPLIKLLSEERSKIMAKIKDEFDKETQIFGIKTIDVRIVKGDLPKENSDAIFTRMQTEREKEAREIRAIGFEESEKIKALANKERTVIIATAKKNSNIIRGQGESKSNKIFAQTFGKDPEFFDFYRSMQAYTRSLGNKNKTTMVISPDKNFFKFFGN